VIRQNRDTLYSANVADISQGVSVTLPGGGGRYMSAMVLNQDHQVNRTFHEPGAHELSVDEFDTPDRLISKLRDTQAHERNLPAESGPCPSSASGRDRVVTVVTAQCRCVSVTLVNPLRRRGAMLGERP
jgi:hypothetical protein